MMRVVNGCGPGSIPPRVRGAVTGEAFKVLHVGIIPAGSGSRAGTDGAVTDVVVGTIPAGAERRSNSALVCLRMRDHPHECVEQWCITGLQLVPAGTSPRVRGVGMPGERYAAADGNIPAGAGSMASRPTPPPRSWDHPRVQGGDRVRPGAATYGLDHPRRSGEQA